MKLWIVFSARRMRYISAKIDWGRASVCKVWSRWNVQMFAVHNCAASQYGTRVYAIVIYQSEISVRIRCIFWLHSKILFTHLKCTISLSWIPIQFFSFQTWVLCNFCSVQYMYWYFEVSLTVRHSINLFLSPTWCTIALFCNIYITLDTSTCFEQ
jgi:hypothetical protein